MTPKRTGASDGWRNVILTARAEALVRANTEPGYTFRQTGTRLADGTYSVPLQESTIARIESMALPGETFSDTLERLFAVRSGSIQ